MLRSLSIRDVVLIDSLDLTLHDGLCVLTGETGAGKSILLDALGLALGNRADQRMLRPGAPHAVVTAVFEVDADEALTALLDERGVAPDDGILVFRRVVGADGRSRAFVNDQPVSAGLLRDLGDLLIEIQGQFEQRGLLNSATHRALLDAYGGLTAAANRVRALWDDWREAERKHQAAEQAQRQARTDQDFLRHALEELDSLDPQAGEEADLASRRAFLMSRETVLEAIAEATDALAGADGQPGAEAAVATARRVLERTAAKAEGYFDEIVAGLDRAASELAEALAGLNALVAGADPDGRSLEEIEARFFALKDVARKHRVEVEALPALRESFAARLAMIDAGDDRLRALAAALAQARDAYVKAAERLSRDRTKAARRLDQAVNGELPPLKLEKARFETLVQRQGDADWGPSGIDHVSFEVATNPGATPGPLGRIASGGELSRFLLALKVVLAAVGPPRSLVFDEVDNAIGGATAHAVGERLEHLARDRQVLVITHSPQVAARGRHHWRVRKEPVGGPAEDRLATRVGMLSPDERREEVARMISGASITEEARAAADRLIGAA